jgi:uncharacterized membrane protein YbhN (UPF0104 family)
VKRGTGAVPLRAAGRSRPAAQVAVRVGISAAVLALLVWLLPFNEVREAIGRMTPLTWAVALAAYLGTHLLGVVKWRLLINTAGAGLSLGQAVRAYYMGLFGNTFLPSIVGGDVVRAGVAFKVARSKAGLILGSLIDRLQDFLALALVAGIGALLAPRALDVQSRRIFLSVAGVLALAGLGGGTLLAVARPRRLPLRVRRRLVRVRQAVRAVGRRPSAMLRALLLGMGLQTLLVVLNYFLGRRVGIDAPLYVWLFVWPLAKLAGVAPTQNGIGVREAAQVALFAPFGVAAPLAMAAGLVFEGIIISGGLLSGLIALGLGRLAKADAVAPPAPEAVAVGDDGAAISHP